MKNLLTVILACVILTGVSQITTAVTPKENNTAMYKSACHEWDTIHIIDYTSLENFDDTVLKRPIYKIEDRFMSRLIDSFSQLIHKIIYSL